MPETGVVPGPASVKLAGTVEGSSTWSKFATIALLMATF